MKTFRLLFAALFLYAGIHAQQACKRTSLFFDTDQSELTAASVKKLDSILTAAGKNQFLVELYGHTDTVGRDAYNDRLALQRMKTIEGYLDAKAAGQFDYKEKNFSETNVLVSRNTAANLAFNRRVDLYLLPVQNGMITLKGSKPSESVEVPVDYFEPCGLCGNQPEFKSYYNEDDTRNTNLTFQTTEGYPLITAGTMMLDYQPCDGAKKKDTASVVFRICDGKPDKNITLWEAVTVNGKVVWKAANNKFTLDPLTGCYVFRAPAGSYYNLDRVRFDTVISLEMPQQFAYYHVIISENGGKSKVRYNEKTDSLAIRKTDTTCLVHGFAKKGEQVYLMKARINTLPDTLKRETGIVYANTFTAPFSLFNALTYSDTTLQVRSDRFFSPKLTYGFYLPDYKEFIPMDSTGGKLSTGRKPNCEYQYAYMKGNRLYVINNKKVQPKYARNGETVQLKFNRKKRKSFHRVSDWKPN